jgi:hypothetical protein
MHDCTSGWNTRDCPDTGDIQMHVIAWMHTSFRMRLKSQSVCTVRYKDLKSGKGKLAVTV